MGTLAIFIGISGTSLSSFDLSIELNFLLHVTQALFVTRRCHQLTCTPHTPSRQRPFALNEVVGYRLALQDTISSAVVIIQLRHRLPFARTSST